MKRAAFLGLFLVLTATSGRPEVSVDRPLSGGIKPFVQVGPTGPWGRVRSNTPAADILNESGDLRGDGVPSVFVNAANGRPEAAWSSGGDDREIMIARHDGTRWLAPLDLSRLSGADGLVAVTTDSHGNRFVAWCHVGAVTDSTYFTALSGDDANQVSPRDLPGTRRHARRPALAVASDDVVYAAYEVDDEPDALVTIVVDRLRVPRDQAGCVVRGGANTIDVARMQHCPTQHAECKAKSDVGAHSESGHLWVDWIDAGGRVGYTELLAGSFTDPRYRPYDVNAGPSAARADIRREVLSR